MDLIQSHLSAGETPMGATAVELSGLEDAHELVKRLGSVIKGCLDYRYNPGLFEVLNIAAMEAIRLQVALLNQADEYTVGVPATFIEQDHPLEGYGTPVIAPGLAREVLTAAAQESDASDLYYRAQGVLANMTRVDSPVS